MGNQQVTMDISQGLPVTDKSTEQGSSALQKLEYAVSGMRGFRATMEDQHLHCTNIPVEGQTSDCLIDHSLFAVFDGHGGALAAEYCAENFLRMFSKRPELKNYANLHKVGDKSRSDTNGITLLKSALGHTFMQLDEELTTAQKEMNERFLLERANLPSSQRDKERPIFLAERSGSTCVIVLVTPSHLVCANAGDSRAILRRNGRVLPLSFDHKPYDIPERTRIVAAGGEVKAKRVDGDLAVSRALGDHLYKMDPSLKTLKQKVIAAPDVTVYPRDYARDEFIVLACDGVWDVASNKDCSDFIQSLLSNGEVNLANICEEAIDTCLEQNSRDNITMMVVGLPGMKADRTQAALVSNAIWGHLQARRAKRLLAHAACASGFAGVGQSAEKYLCSTRTVESALCSSRKPSLSLP